jgi:hypothetical protein
MRHTCLGYVGAKRVTYEPDYGRRGKVRVSGARQMATGYAAMLTGSAGVSASYIQLLEQVIVLYPADRWLIIEENLGARTSRQTQMGLLAWPTIELQSVSTYAY